MYTVQNYTFYVAGAPKMGKLLITNSPEWDGMLRKIFADSGFCESAHTECCGARVTAYKKLCVDNCNWYSCGDDFVACAGTLIYRENFGEDALRMLYEDSRTMTVTELRKNLIGSYVIAVKNGDEIRVFVDETHIYKFYYYADGGKYILTSTFYHVEKCAKQPLHDDAFLEKNTRSGIMSRQTQYQNVYTICAREYFRINLADGTCSVEKCPLNDYHRKFASREEALDTLFEEAKRISALRSKFIHSHRIFLTGGLDSRLEYAMHLYNHDDVRPAYWMSSYEMIITNGTQNDWEIVRKLADTGGGSARNYLTLPNR